MPGLTSYRLEALPGAACRIRWICSLAGFTANGTRTTTATRARYESVADGSSDALRLLSPNTRPGDDLKLASFQIEPLSGSVDLTLRIGAADENDPEGAPVSWQVIDTVTIPLGSCLQLDEGAGGWRLVTKTTTDPLV